jgi:hypothetical protein
MTRPISRKRALLALLISLILSLPIGWIVAMLLTPALWRLEPVLKLELAGHSGPSDWVIVVIWGLVAVVLFLVWRRLCSHPKSTSNQ